MIIRDKKLANGVVVHLHEMFGFSLVPCRAAFFPSPNSLHLLGLVIFDYEIDQLTAIRFGGA